VAIEWVPVEAASWGRLRWASAARDDSLAAIDPYLIWADVTRFEDLKQPDSEAWFPVILELAAQAGNFAQRCIDEGWDWIRIPSVYRCPPKWLEPARFCTAAVTREAFEKLGGELKGYVQRFQLGCPVFSGAKVESDAQATDFDAEDHPCLGCASDNASRSRLPTIVGVIDEGLAFAHERFREIVRGRTTSRIEYFWNQNEDLKREGPDCGMGYGSELSRSKISELLKAATHGSQIDEDEVYRQARHGTVGRRLLHGTHVMDLAADENPKEASASSPRIICVELPKQMVRDTSGLSLAVHALDAIRYVLDRAACIARALQGGKSRAHCPVVVNLSFGNIAGPHDGSSMLEAAIDELIRLGEAATDRSRLQVVLPAGNNHLSRCHAQVVLAAGAEETLQWRILPDDATPSFVEIWISGDDADDGLVAIEVTPPGGPGSGWVHLNEVRCAKVNGSAICTIVHLNRVATGNGRMILVAVAPTCTTSATRNVAPAGTWRVRIRNEARRSKEALSEPVPVTVDAWIQRDDTPIGFPRRGRQSRFDDARYVRFDRQGHLEEEDVEDKDLGPSTIKRAGTLNAIATGDHTIVIGGYRASDGEPAPYSASGPTRSETRVGPDAMAISERSVALRGVLGTGGRSGSRIAMGGTSFAAPKVTRLIAKRMRKGLPANREAVRELAKQSEPDDDQAKPPDERGGGGRLGFRGNLED
jgi:hypothetical protein